MPDFSIPLSGLAASSEGLNVISNNLANLNTVGYKDETASFHDLFYQLMGTNGANDPVQVGQGVAVASISPNFNDGNVQSTGVDTNAAISGNGFFVVQQGGALQFTRAGDFTTNTEGQLVTQQGQYVMGYPAVNGAITPGGALSTLTLNKGQLIPGFASTSLNMQTNLDARAAVGASFSPSQIQVYDSLGNSHVLSFQFTKTGTNAWDYQITLPAADTGGSGNPTVVATGTMSFNPDGSLATPASPITGIAINGLADGASPMSLSWDLADAAGNGLMTQSAQDTATSTSYQDGYGSGTLLNFSIESDGVIQGSFSNGQTLALGQIALANFSNQQGLQHLGNNSFQASLSSGQPVIGVAGTGGRGTLTGDAVEQSNVDIATEFANMIVTQRGFQANARVITTFDQITQETIAMKQ